MLNSNYIKFNPNYGLLQFKNTEARGGLISAISENETCNVSTINSNIPIFDASILFLTPQAWKASLLLSTKPLDSTGDFTVVRATTATRVNKNGIIESVIANAPRIDYTGGGCASVLIEPQRTNICLRSEEIDSATWVKINAGTGVLPAVTANAVTSPDGTTNADTIVLDRGAGNTGGDYSWFYQSATFAADFYALSFWIKTSVIGDVGKTILARLSASNASQVVTLTSTWTRITIVSSSAGAAAAAEIEFFNRGTLTTGNSVSIDLWGVQVEQAKSSSSYIPTTSASVTRNADEIYKTGISSLIPQPEGSIFVDCVVDSFNGNATVNILNAERTSACSFYCYIDTSNNIIFGILDGGSAVLTLTATDASFLVGQRLKILINFKTGSSKLYVNGVLKDTQVSAFTLSSTWDDIFINDKTTYFASQGLNRYKQISFLPFISDSAQSIQLTTL